MLREWNRNFFAHPSTAFEARSSHSHPGLQSVYMNWHHHHSLFHQCLMQIVFVWVLFIWAAFLKKCVHVWRRESETVGCAHTPYYTLMPAGFWECVRSHWSTKYTRSVSVSFLNSLHLLVCCWWALLSHSSMHKGHGGATHSCSTLKQIAECGKTTKY